MRRRWAQPVLLMAFGAVVGIGAVWFSVTITTADEADQKANEAQEAAARAERIAIGVRAVIVSDKICSETNQMACRSLFDRLARNISRQQRFRLGCAVMVALDTPNARREAQAAECPPLLYPPRGP